MILAALVDNYLATSSILQLYSATVQKIFILLVKTDENSKKKFSRSAEKKTFPELQYKMWIHLFWSEKKRKRTVLDFSSSCCNKIYTIHYSIFFKFIILKFYSTVGDIPNHNFFRDVMDPTRSTSTCLCQRIYSCCMDLLEEITQALHCSGFNEELRS